MEITKELIEQAKKDIITSVEDGRMRINSQRLLFKLLTEAMNYIPCCDKLPNIESTEFRDWMTDNGYTDEQYGTMQKGDERYCINTLFKHYQNLLQFGN